MISNEKRAAIRDYAISGGMRYRIVRNGEVHFYGVMPNSVVIGWYLFAQSVDEAIKRIAA